ncbi:MAG: hypothetical protein AAB501_03725 [Patescibacteria group bacterium]
MSNITSRVYKPSDFSEGLWHEVLVTLGKKGFSPEMAVEIMNTKSGKAAEIVSLFPQVLDTVSYWRNFYKDFCGLDVDFSKAKVSDLQGDFTRVLGIPQGLTPNRMYEACEKHFPCWHYTDDLDKATAGLNERESAESYFVRVRDRVEADEEFRNTSADAIKGNGIKTETLLERLVHEGVFYHETGEHLDIQNWTLCAGSRNTHGFVPHVSWRDGKMFVYWCDPQNAGDGLRARAVVS